MAFLIGAHAHAPLYLFTNLSYLLSLLITHSEVGEHEVRSYGMLPGTIPITENIAADKPARFW